MTREERDYAKSRIEYLLKICRFDERDREALELAIKALSQEPCERFEWGIDGNVYKITKAKDGKEICQQVCKDAISREWLKTAIHNFYDGLKHTPTEEDIQAYIDVAPPATQKSGKWIRHDNGKYHWFLCSCCDAMAGSDEKRIAYRFCPNCGARMESEE